LERGRQPKYYKMKKVNQFLFYFLSHSSFLLFVNQHDCALTTVMSSRTFYCIRHQGLSSKKEEDRWRTCVRKYEAQQPRPPMLDNLKLDNCNYYFIELWDEYFYKWNKHPRLFSYLFRWLYFILSIFCTGIYLFLFVIVI
jgi:hypothetical protein